MCSEIVVVPFPHPGHIFPATELCNHLARRNYKITLFLPSTSSSPALHPLITVISFSLPHPTRFSPHLLGDILPDLISRRFDGPDCDSSPLPICAIVDDMIGWLIDAFVGLQIPAVVFFTSSACSAALHHAASRLTPADLTPGRPVRVPGLPDDVALAPTDLAHRGPRPGPPMRPWSERGPRPDRGPRTRGAAPANLAHSGPPPRPAMNPRSDRGPRIRGAAPANGAFGLLFNTCDDLERAFLEYVTKETGKPVWGVGPLLPAQLWSSSGSLVRDGEVRSEHESNISKKEVMEWLDAQPRGSVIYVAFGTLVGPTDEELAELAAGLAESKRPFIWVIRPGATRHDPDGRPVRAMEGGLHPDELARRAGNRGLVIKGWAPQLEILSHAATGGYVCHCGWNSATEAVACGVPVLAWPVRGDQLHNARLLTARLGVGLAVKDGGEAAAVTRGDVVRGIERLMGDGEIRKRAAALRSVFAAGIPKSAAASLDAFLHFVKSHGRQKQMDG